MSPQPLKGKRLSDIKLKTRLFGGVTINARTVVAPLFAFTMAGLLFVYSRTSIQAAKRNAKSHRIADGGQISWYVLPFCLMTSVNLFGRPLVYNTKAFQAFSYRLGISTLTKMDLGTMRTKGDMVP